MMIKTELSSWQQGWWDRPRAKGLTGICQEIQDIALLPTQRNNNGQDTLDKTTASLALAAETTLAPDNTTAQGLLSGIVGRFNCFLVDKGPQGRLAFENVTAGGLSLPVLDQECPQLQQAFDFTPNGTHGFLERLAGQGAITDTMPQGKEQLDLGQQQTTDKGGIATSVNPSLEIPL